MATERTYPDGSRVLAPHIWQHPERLGGDPAIEGHRIAPAIVYGLWRHGAEWPGIRESYDLTEYEFVAAVAFEAGVKWQREQDDARKRARLARRWERGQRAAQGGAGDGDD